MNHPDPLTPNDEFNKALEGNVHPKDYRNPRPYDRYNLVVIGAGTAGLVTASIAAGLGAKVALVERGLMGGDCLNVGCVPSKALIASARSVAAIQKASSMGIHATGEINVDFPQVMQRMRRLRSGISHHDSVKRFTNLGVDVFLGQASFKDSNTVEVNGDKLKFKKAVICTGARAAAPRISGLDGVRYLTNESLFSLTELPKRLGVVGAGPIGCEMAQAFALFGSQVTLINNRGCILFNEDQEGANIIHDSLVKDGVRILTGGHELEISNGNEEIVLNGVDRSTAFQHGVDQLLVAAGRRPNVEGLNLEKVGVRYGERRISIDDDFKTSNRNIYAAGDICSPFQFTHAADFMARAVVRNALFFGRQKHTRLTIPWCTYTSPELAQIGLNAAKADRRDLPIDTYTIPMSQVDRAILEEETDGFVRVHTHKGSDQIVGGTIVAPNAGDMIGALSIAMTHDIGLGKIANAIHPYPTQGEALRKVGDLYNKTRFTPGVAKWFKRWLEFIR